MEPIQWNFPLVVRLAFCKGLKTWFCHLASMSGSGGTEYAKYLYY